MLYVNVDKRIWCDIQVRLYIMYVMWTLDIVCISVRCIIIERNEMKCSKSLEIF